MNTTIELPDELIKQARRVAQQEGECKLYFRKPQDSHGLALKPDGSGKLTGS